MFLLAEYSLTFPFWINILKEWICYSCPASTFSPLVWKPASLKAKRGKFSASGHESCCLAHILSFSCSVFLKQPTPRQAGLKRNLLMWCFLLPLFDIAFPLFHEWYPVSLGQEITIKGFLFLVFHIKRNSCLVDIVSLIKLLCLSFKNIFSASSVLPLHLFCFALFWFFLGGGRWEVLFVRGFLSPFCMVLDLILVPFCLWGFILLFGSRHSGNLRILMSASSYLKSYSDHCRCWETLWGIWGFFCLFALP